MNDKIQFIRQKCIEANPEIAELKFGCEVVADVGEWDGYEVVHEIGICSRHKRASSCNGDCDFENGVMLTQSETDEPFTINLLKSSLKKIIGRPIRLADVLLAIEKASDERHGIRAEKDGWFSGVLESVVTMYNLRADDLEKQTEDTINFVHKLLQ